MAIYLSNRNGNGQTDEEGHYRFTSSMWGGDVIDGVNVTQNSPLGMSVLIQPGDFKIDTAAGYAYQGWIDTADEVTISAANPSNPRLDRIVLYVDLNETTAASPANNPGIIKSMAVAGTPAAVPVAPNNAAVNSAVGSGNPWIEVARVLVNSSVTQITDGNITDFREFVTAPADSVDTSQIKDDAVTPEKRSGGFFTAVLVTNSTGSKQVTGIGFTPKFAMFIGTISNSDATASISVTTWDGTTVGGAAVAARPNASSSAASRTRNGGSNIGNIAISSAGSTTTYVDVTPNSFGNGTFDYTVNTAESGGSITAIFWG